MVKKFHGLVLWNKKIKGGMYQGGNNYHRHSVRLREYDYGQSGWYYITVCAYRHASIFGRVENGKMVLNRLGEIIQNNWYDISRHFKNAELDEFVVMPNHIHGIVVITNNKTVGATLAVAQKHSIRTNEPFRAGARPAPTLGDIIGGFKSRCTNQWLQYIKINNLNVVGHVWQRNYYEHIIRNEKSLAEIREYIYNNPTNWMNDKENLGGGNLTERR